MISTAALSLCHLLFIIIPSSQPSDKSYWGVVPIVLMGLTYSIYVSALWPMVALVVKPQVVGSAYGMCTAIQNIGLALGPLMVGGLTFSNKGSSKYLWVNISLGI